MARRVGIIPIQPVQDDVFPRIELLDDPAVGEVTESRVGVVFGYVKFCRQAGSIAVPDSVSIRVLPDKLEGPLLVEVFLALHRSSAWRDGLPAPLGRRTLNSTATR